jgi:muramidase (phage lysozyme)
VSPRAAFGFAAAVLAWLGLQAPARAALRPDDIPAQNLFPDLPEPMASPIPPEFWPDAGYADPDAQARNLAAFGAAIAKAEGTATGPNAGYDVLFGWPAAGRTFDSASAPDHPRRLFPFTDQVGRQLKSSAAGRYQINAPTYDDMRRRYRLPAGFTPEHQERLFVALLDASGALEHAKAGRFEDAVAAARSRWASLPGAGAHQLERSMAYVRAAYLAAGGALA